MGARALVRGSKDHLWELTEAEPFKLRRTTTEYSVRIQCNEISLVLRYRKFIQIKSPFSSAVERQPFKLVAVGSIPTVGVFFILFLVWFIKIPYIKFLLIRYNGRGSKKDRR